MLRPMFRYLPKQQIRLCRRNPFPPFYIPRRFKHDEGVEETDKKKQENEDKALFQHHTPTTWIDKTALQIVKWLRIPTDMYFAKRYGHRAVVLETIAAVPGMVGGMLLHMKSLRKMRVDHGIINTLLDEAANERMHLMAFIKIAKPTFFERMIVLSAQGGFFIIYLLVYICHPKLAHRIVGYLEEEAIVSYTSYLEEIEAGRIENVPAPDMAIEYWNLPKDAKLRELVIAIRKDEQNHRDVNHYICDSMVEGQPPDFDGSLEKEKEGEKGKGPEKGYEEWKEQEEEKMLKEEKEKEKQQKQHL
eukprot:Phypoly_transcript_12887.p1 GENE.Phypoly_transcript_12887~~Phypoly_transcript_12887.p1  ORF type:complete len:303 (+),score=70.85 Phypoly_transcript_12887:84-992(+)